MSSAWSRQRQSISHRRCGARRPGFISASRTATRTTRPTSTPSPPIRWTRSSYMNSTKKLVLLTTSSEYILAASRADEAVTPTNVRVSRETNFGTANVRPIRAGPAMLFAQRAGDNANAGAAIARVRLQFPDRQLYRAGPHHPVRAHHLSGFVSRGVSRQRPISWCGTRAAMATSPG
jgi:hypothetical protein